MDQPAKPIIDFASQTASNVGNAVKEPSNIGNFIQRNLAKIIFGLLGLVILAELIIGFRTLTGGTKFGASVPKIQSMSDPKIVIKPTQSNVRVGQVVEVKALVVTGGKSTDSTDLILHFDPKFLSATDSSAIKIGEIYSDYPVTVVDSTLGEIAVSGITLPKSKPFEGIGTLATFYFRALKEGKTALIADFQKGSTSDSNVVLTGTAQDILDQVFNAEINIGNQTAEAPKPTSCSGYTQYCQTTDGKTGRQFCNLGKKETFTCAFDPQLTISCDVCKTD